MKSRTISFYMILLLLVLVPTITVSISLSIVMYNMTSREIRDSMNNSMVSYITEMGIAYDNTTETAKTIMGTFASNPDVISYLKNQDDTELGEKYRSILRIISASWTDGKAFILPVGNQRSCRIRQTL